jgi:hypothetical protein
VGLDCRALSQFLGLDDRVDREDEASGEGERRAHFGPVLNPSSVTADASPGARFGDRDGDPSGGGGNRADEGEPKQGALVALRSLQDAGDGEGADDRDEGGCRGP